MLINDHLTEDYLIKLNNALIKSDSGTFIKKENSKMSNVDETLQERGNRYGEFANHSAITQALKRVAEGDITLPIGDGVETIYVPETNFKTLSPAHKEALDMIFHKIGRILNGDPNYTDSWHDIAGYATLAEKECQ